MKTSSPETSNIAIWERAIQPARRTLDSASARALLELKLSRRDLNRADALAVSSSQGKLSDEEVTELENYRSVGTALEFLKSKARRSLVKTR